LEINIHCFAEDIASNEVIKYQSENLMLPKVGNGKVELISVPSTALGKDIFAKIYIPFGYTKQAQYPVLYIFHGGGGNQDSWMPQLGLEIRADDLIHQKKIKPLIIVAPEMGPGYAGGAHEDFISKELIRYIDTHYSTDPNRKNRFIGGLSMGGFIALHHAFLHPDLFSKVGGHSPYLYTEEGLNDAVENPIITAKSGAKDLTSLKVYLDSGIADPYNLVAPNAELFRSLRGKGVMSENHPNPGGHDIAYWKGNIDNYLKFYAGI
jgi:enterochelin esterase-like enzyme